MSTSPLAGTLPTAKDLIDPAELEKAYYSTKPDPQNPAQRVAFGTSGHRGTALQGSFNEDHILAVTQAVCEVRAQEGIKGPLFLGVDSHALSAPAMRTALEVLTANGVCVGVEADGGFSPTPVISHAILKHNREEQSVADGIIITPSHNPPADGGFKYNPPTGGPAGTDVTKRIADRANELLNGNNADVKRFSETAINNSGLVKPYAFADNYVNELDQIIDVAKIAASGLSLGADPLGGATLTLWQRLAEKHKLPLQTLNPQADPTFSFVPLDHDGQIRMDCSSAYVMSGLLQNKDRFDLLFACDPDADRHGIVTKQGLMNPNHYLSVVAWHLFQSRPQWKKDSGIGKTVVTTSMLNRIAEALGRPIYEVPVGFKWFVDGLVSGNCGMGCEESAGASFLCFDGSPWSTDKDGPLLCLLAAEMMAVHGKSPSEMYLDLTARFGNPAYARIDSPLDAERRARFAKLSASQISAGQTLAGDSLTNASTTAPANNEAIGGIKLETQNGWVAARPSGTEPICKVYTESFVDEKHRAHLEKDAVELLNTLLQA